MEHSNFFPQSFQSRQSCMMIRVRSIVNNEWYIGTLTQLSHLVIKLFHNLILSHFSTIHAVESPPVTLYASFGFVFSLFWLSWAVNHLIPVTKITCMATCSIERKLRVKGTALAMAQINTSFELVKQIKLKCNSISCWLLVILVVCLPFVCVINGLILWIGAKESSSLALTVTCIITSANHTKHFVPVVLFRYYTLNDLCLYLGFLFIFSFWC